MIESIEQAFDRIDHQNEGIPFEAIDFLRDQEKNEEIGKKLVFAIKNTYNPKVYFSDAHQVMLPAPLWYSVVAEKHTHVDLVEPILDLFTVEEDWDIMNEQAVYLLGLVAKEFPEAVIPKVLDYIEKQIKKDNAKPYLYSFEALYYAKEEHFSRIYELLQKDNFHWIDHYIRIIGDLMREDSVEHLKSLLPKYEGKHTAIELKYYIDALEGKNQDFKPDKAFCEMRQADWKEHYDKMLNMFASNESPIQTSGKINRNDPCPCGSGKKYKNCCLKNMA